MKLHHLNLVGVLILCGLCAGQWMHDRDLNLEINRLEHAGHEQSSRFAEQERSLRGLEADLTQFKGQITGSDAELKDTREKLRAAEVDLRQLIAERDQLKTSVSHWAAAVTVRDERLKKDTAQTRRLADELNVSILKFNTLATDHNAMVKDLNDLRARTQKPQQ